VEQPYSIRSREKVAAYRGGGELEIMARCGGDATADKRDFMAR
jgi:hypothetical protein